MLVKFNRPLKFGAQPNVKGREKTLNYPKQALPQEVPDFLKEDKFFQAHLKAGDISLVAAAQAPSKEEQDEAPSSKGKSGR